MLSFTQQFCQRHNNTSSGIAFKWVKVLAAAATLIIPLILWFLGLVVLISALPLQGTKDIVSLLLFAVPIVLAPFGLIGLMMVALGTGRYNPYIALKLIIAGFVALLWATGLFALVNPIVALICLGPLGMTGATCLRRVRKQITEIKPKH